MSLIQSFEACTQSPGLSALMSHARRLERLDAMLAQWIEPELKAHCQVVGLEEDALVILVDGSTWLTWLRFASAQWLPEVRQQPGFEKITRLVWRLGDWVVPPPMAVVKGQARTMPAEAKAAWKDLMLALEDSPLRSALKRMVERSPVVPQ